MNKFYLYCITFLLFYACTGSKKEQVEFKAIENVLNQQVEEWQAGNIDGFMEGYWHSDSLRFITKSGVKTGYDSVCNNYKKHYDTPEKRGHLAFSDLNFYILDNQCEVVQCTGKWEITGNSPETNQSGIFSLIFKDIKGEWKIIVDHTW